MLGLGLSTPETYVRGMGPLPVFRSALAATRAGRSRTVIAMIGDSVTAGQWGGNPANSWANDAHAGAVPAQLQAAFQAAYGLPFAGKAQFGNGSVSGITSGSALAAYNAELFIGTDWTTDATARSLGGSMLVHSTSTLATFGFPDTSFDTIELYYPTHTALTASLDIRFNGVTVATISEQASAGVRRQIFMGIGGAAGVGVRTTGPITKACVIGLISYSAANKGVQVLNLGASGWTAADWLFGGDVEGHGPKYALPTVFAHLTTICLGITDWQNAVPIADYKANLIALHALARRNPAGGEVLFVAPNRVSTAVTPQATQDAYVQAMKEVAAQLNALFFDVAAGVPAFVDYATANAAGYMGDTRHPNRAGYGVWAAAMLAFIRTPAGQ